MSEERIVLDCYISSNKKHALKNYIGAAVLVLYVFFVYNVMKHHLSLFGSELQNIILWMGIALILAMIYPITMKITQYYYKKHFLIIEDHDLIFQLGFRNQKRFNANLIDVFTLEPSYIKIIKKDGLVFKLRYHLNYSAKENLKNKIQSFNKRNNIKQSLLKNEI